MPIAAEAPRLEQTPGVALQVRYVTQATGGLFTATALELPVQTADTSRDGAARLLELQVLAMCGAHAADHATSQGLPVREPPAPLLALINDGDPRTRAFHDGVEVPVVRAPDRQRFVGGFRLRVAFARWDVNPGPPGDL